jgi:hypothetical protein
MNELMSLLLAGVRVTDVLTSTLPDDRRVMVKWRIGLRRGYTIL